MIILGIYDMAVSYLWNVLLFISYYSVITNHSEKSIVFKSVVKSSASNVKLEIIYV